MCFVDGTRLPHCSTWIPALPFCRIVAESSCPDFGARRETLALPASGITLLPSRFRMNAARAECCICAQTTVRAAGLAITVGRRALRRRWDISECVVHPCSRCCPNPYRLSYLLSVRAQISDSDNRTTDRAERPFCLGLFQRDPLPSRSEPSARFSCDLQSWPDIEVPGAVRYIRSA